MSKVKFCEGGEREVSVGKDMYPSLSWRFSTPEGDCGLCQKCPKQWKSLILHKYLQLHSPLWKKSCDQPRQHIQKQRHCFVDKGLSTQSYGFSSGHVRM